MMQKLLLEFFHPYNFTKKLKKIFNTIDISQNGELNLMLLEKLLLALEIKLQSAEIIVLFKYADKTHEGKIDFDDFLQFLKKPLNVNSTL